jgi:hypothetical protein
MRSELAEFGFHTVAPGRYRSGDVELELRADWLVLRAPRRTHARKLDLGPLDERGPWKSVAEGRHRIRVAELPARISGRISADADDATLSASPLQDAIRWTLRARDGFWDDSWNCPSRDQVLSWLSPENMTIASGRHARQAELVADGSRLALRAAILPTIPQELPAPRAAWLDELLMETQAHWRMVRTGYVDSRSSAMAEVDFSGAPLSILEPLVRAGAAALHAAVCWSIRSADFLIDLQQTCYCLEVRPSRAACVMQAGK